MHTIGSGRQLKDFVEFCSALDIKEVVGAADEFGNAEGYDKEIFALAILRALDNGDFGDDPMQVQVAVADFWRRGHVEGFSMATFNRVFIDHFAHW